ncbi:MAG: hypothetical protein J0H91_22020 [Rhodospirillales bacterium]|nr:hypothetical protein [Rhodospirillales bacterium]
MAHVAHTTDVHLQRQRDGGQHDNADQQRGHRLGQPREQLDDGKPARDHHIGQRWHVGQFRQLRHEDPDRNDPRNSNQSGLMEEKAPKNFISPMGCRMLP